MNAARRARQKANRSPDTTHPHLNRAARTDAEGKVERCLFCRPVRNDNEQAHMHGTQVLRRPVSGAIRWAASPHGKKVPAAKTDINAVENLARVQAVQEQMQEMAEDG